MEEEEIVDNHFHAHDMNSTMMALTWWEKKRIWFNLAVGLAGLAAISLNFHLFLNFDIIGIIFYGLFANLLYSVGFLLEVFDNYYFNDRLKLHRFRLPLFLIGTISFCFMTFFMAMVLYSINF